MQFHIHDAEWDRFRKSPEAQAFRRMIRDDKVHLARLDAMLHSPKAYYEREHDNDEFNLTSGRPEMNWIMQSRPYYKVYPSIVNALCRIPLDTPMECPKVPPQGSILIRFAVGSEPSTKCGRRIKFVFVGNADMDPDLGIGDCLFISFGEVGKESHNKFFLSPKGFDHENIGENMTMEQTIESCTCRSCPNDAEITKIAARIALTVCMLADDPEIITPDVLSKHQERYDREKDENWKREAERKAKNKGVFGWSVGKNLEVTPHFRRPHWAIRHFGPKGKSVPKIVPIKGCKVKGGKLTTVPTGYMRDDGTEIENGNAVATSK